MRSSLMTGAGLAALLVLGRVSAADAQVALNIHTCNAQALAALNGNQQLTMNDAGQLCVNATPVIGALDFGFVAGSSSRVKNTVTISGTTAETLLAGTSGLHNYLTDLMCFRTDTGTTLAYVTLNDDNSTAIPLPQGSGAAPPINVPIVSNGTNTAITFTSQAGVTGTCTARGYTGTDLIEDLPTDALPQEAGRSHLAFLDNLNGGLVTA